MTGIGTSEMPVQYAEIPIYIGEAQDGEYPEEVDLHLEGCEKLIHFVRYLQWWKVH